MNRPSALVRLCGSPLVAAVLLLLCAAVVLSWWHGHASGVLAFLAVLAGLGSLKAAVRWRGYEAWAREWRAMGGEAPQVVKQRPAWLAPAVAALLVVGIPYCASPGNAALRLLWLAAVCYLGVAVVLRLVHLLRRPRTVNAKAARENASVPPAPVAWLLGRAMSSPSRAEAASNLPEYCAGLLDERTGK